MEVRGHVPVRINEISKKFSSPFNPRTINATHTMPVHWKRNLAVKPPPHQHHVIHSLNVYRVLIIRFITSDLLQKVSAR
jgi:hypothetical protein